MLLKQRLNKENKREYQMVFSFINIYADKK